MEKNSTSHKEKLKLVLVTGPTAVGKTKLSNFALENRPDHLTKFVTTATRDMRPGEKQGESYHFMSISEFKKMCDVAKFFEYEEVFADNWYGCEKQELERIARSGKIAIATVDVNGALKFAGKMASTKKSYVDLDYVDPTIFFISATKEELVFRIHKDYEDGAREGGEKVLRKRLDRMNYELEQAQRFENIIFNHNGESDFASNELVNNIARLTGYGNSHITGTMGGMII